MDERQEKGQWGTKMHLFDVKTMMHNPIEDLAAVNKTREDVAPLIGERLYHGIEHVQGTRGARSTFELELIFTCL